MKNLDNLEEIKKLDPKDVFGSTEKFLDQCVQIHEMLSDFSFKQNFSGVENIVFSGMGGSSYGAYEACSLYKYTLDIPVCVNNDYDLPEFVDEKSLVIVTSYSGSTEEALYAFDEARNRGAKIIVLTSGGELAKRVENSGFDAVVFDPQNNPSGQPRLGTGYIVLGTVEILIAINFLDIDRDAVTKAIDEISSRREEIKNKAKELAYNIQGYIAVIFAAEHLSGNAHIIRNQFNETAKSFSSFHIIPEANHHLLEGLKNPGDKKLIGFLFESDLYNERIKKRMDLTREVIEKNNVGVLSYKALSSSKLAQALEVLMFGGYLTFYLAILYDQDPSLIPWVDFFKERLKT